jgi:hypothetical protein
MFNSKELLNASETASSLTHTLPNLVNIDNIKEELKRYILIKNNNSIKSYDFGNLNRINTNSSGETLKGLLNVVKEFYIYQYKEDNNKILLIKKLFDNIINSLDCVIISGIDLTSVEINSLILGYLNKNFF